jgi:hypothetical protein
MPPPATAAAAARPGKPRGQWATRDLDGPGLDALLTELLTGWGGGHSSCGPWDTETRKAHLGQTPFLYYQTLLILGEKDAPKIFFYLKILLNLIIRTLKMYFLIQAPAHFSLNARARSNSCGKWNIFHDDLRVQTYPCHLYHFCWSRWALAPSTSWNTIYSIPDKS